MSKLHEVNKLGQSIWLDNLSRTIIKEGELAKLVNEDGVTGITSNPAIFQKALTDSPYYQEQLTQLKASTPDAEMRYEAMVIPDIQAACDILLATYTASNGNDGYVSLEVSPNLANDTDATVAAAKRLHAAVSRPNLLIKIPATPAGLVAFEQVIGLGISVNVTLLFSISQTVRTFEAYIRGLRVYIANGGNGRDIKAVASLFLSRVDSNIDPRLIQIGTPAASALQGHAALAIAKLAYQRYKQFFHGEYFADLARAGCRPQYLLWASTGTKNKAYPDVKYLDNLIGAETINTVPGATLDAFRDHGTVADTVENGVDTSLADYLALENLGIYVDEVGETLQLEGVKIFADAYQQILATC
ncbi:MAG: transaldolase [Sulfuriferula sp.]